MSLYSRGSDVLGGETAKVIVVRLNDAGGVARSRGGLASLAQAVAPKTVESQVYSEAAKEIEKGLAGSKIPASVNVVSDFGAPQKGNSSGSEYAFLALGAILGAGAMFLLKSVRP